MFSGIMENMRIALWLLALLVITPAIAYSEAGLQTSSNNKADAQVIEQTYFLGAGDLLKISVFGQDDLSGEYSVDGRGVISFPLIGSVKSNGLTVIQLEQEIAKKLKDGYLKNPRVSIAVIVFRPFYILGEVKKPGSYPYVSGMTIWNAVALSGGFTKRADKNDIIIKRTVGSNENAKAKATVNSVVMPGDIITIEQRLF